MTRVRNILMMAALFAMALPAQRGMGPRPDVARQDVELRGTVVNASLNCPATGGGTPGLDMPFVEVKTEAGETVKVLLCPIRRLIEQDFSPKAGDRIEVKGFRWGGDAAGEVVATTVTLPDMNKTLELGGRGRMGRGWHRGWAGAQSN